jgi:hypothetical protein
MRKFKDTTLGIKKPSAWRPLSTYRNSGDEITSDEDIF